MKHRYIVIVAAGCIVLAASLFLLTSATTRPSNVHQSAPAGQESPNTQDAGREANRTGFIPEISKVIIPMGSVNQSSGKNYEPRYLVVVLGVNNTVRWENKDRVANFIAADNRDDPLFWNATHPSGAIFPGSSFDFTFTKAGEFGYHGYVFPWLKGEVLVLPQSPENAVQTVTLNESSGIPGPCETFGIPCPLNPSHTFSAQKIGLNIYIEKFTGNGVDYHAIIHNSKICTFSTNYGGSCTNPDDLAVLRFIGVDTSVPQKIADVSITGLKPQYLVGEPIDFDIQIQGYDPCDFPSVSVMQGPSVVWKGASGAVSCLSPLVRLDETWYLNSLGGPIILNQTGTYTILVRYDSNMTQQSFDVVSQKSGG